MATHKTILHSSLYDSDSGADSDVPGTLTQRKKMNDAHARALAHRFVQAPIETSDGTGLTYQENSKSQVFTRLNISTRHRSRKMFLTLKVRPMIKIYSSTGAKFLQLFHIRFIW